MVRFRNLKFPFTNSGQALIVVILAMVVVLTIGLSAATRNIANIRMTSEEESSQRALAAAEAGVEQALKTTTNGVVVTGKPLANASIQKTEIIQISGVDILLNGGEPVRKGESVDVWLSTYSGGTYSNQWSGYVYIYWQDPSKNDCTNTSSNNVAALDIIAVSKPAAGTLADADIRQYPTEPCVSTRKALNNFCPNIPDAVNGPQRCYRSDGSTTDGSYRFLPGSPHTNTYSSGSRQFLYRASVSFNDSAANFVDPGLLLRITPLYNDTVIGIKGRSTTSLADQALPAQEQVIESVGTAGGTQRKIVVRRPYPKIPNELFYSIYSP